MNDARMLSRIEQVKKEIHDSVSVNDEAICALCDELISLAQDVNDWESVAFGYIWRADYYFYVASDMNSVSKMLDYAQKYIDEKKASALLEKFYTLKHILFENSFEIYAAFHYCLKALAVSEKLGMQARICANYGNIGSYFLDYGCYEEALFYTKKSIEILRSSKEAKPRMLRLILSNLVQIYSKLDQPELIKASVVELSMLPIEDQDLKVYVDHGYLIYYAQAQNQEKSLYYLDELLRGELLRLPNHSFTIELLTSALEAMMQIQHQDKAKEILMILQGLIKEENPEPRLALLKSKILYVKQFGTEDELRNCYREYYVLYSMVQDRMNQLNIDGMRAKIALNDTRLEFDESKNELYELHDLANMDELTRVYNRRYFNIKSEELLNSKEHVQIGFALFDIDYFKEYNDYYGHLEGDKILKLVASCLQMHTTQHTAAFRYGGDEFVCLSWGEDCVRLGAYTAKVASTLKEKNVQHNRSRCAKQVTLSIGYGSRVVSSKVELFALFDAVDKALYAAKFDGRNNAKAISDQKISKGENHA